MKKNLWIGLALTLMLIAPLTLMAQPPFADGSGFFGGDGPGFHRGERGERGLRGLLPPPGYLDLSDEQIEAIQAIAESVRADLEPLREAGKAVREQLHSSLESDDPNPTEIGQLMLDSRALREQGREIVESYEGQFTALLTPEQVEKWENFREMREARRERRETRRGGR